MPFSASSGSSRVMRQQGSPAGRPIIKASPPALTAQAPAQRESTRAACSAIVLVNELRPHSYDRPKWCALPAGLQRTVLRECVRQVMGDTTDLKYAGIEEARTVLNSQARTGEIAVLSELRILVTPLLFQLHRLL